MKCMYGKCIDIIMSDILCNNNKYYLLRGKFVSIIILKGDILQTLLVEYNLLKIIFYIFYYRYNMAGAND